MKILCVVYDDPEDGMPKNQQLSELPKLKKYPHGMTPHTSGTSLSAHADMPLVQERYQNAFLMMYQLEPNI